MNLPEANGILLLSLKTPVPSGELTSIDDLDPFTTIKPKSFVNNFLKGNNIPLPSATEIIALFFCSPSIEASTTLSLFLVL
jgi:hypothetical protein